MSPEDQFKHDFSEWERRMLLLAEDDEAGIDDIKGQIRSDWTNKEKRQYWFKRASEEAHHTRELEAMGRGIVENIKSSAKKKEA